MYINNIYYIHICIILKFWGRVQKNFFSNFEYSYLSILTIKFNEIFTTWYQISKVQDPLVRFFKKVFFFISLENATEMAVFNGFGQKNGLGPLGDKQVKSTHFPRMALSCKTLPLQPSFEIGCCKFHRGICLPWKEPSTLENKK